MKTFNMSEVNFPAANADWKQELNIESFKRLVSLINDRRIAAPQDEQFLMVPWQSFATIEVATLGQDYYMSEVEDTSWKGNVYGQFPFLHISHAGAYKSAGHTHIAWVWDSVDDTGHVWGTPSERFREAFEKEAELAR